MSQPVGGRIRRLAQWPPPPVFGNGVALVRNGEVVRARDSDGNGAPDEPVQVPATRLRGELHAFAALQSDRAVRPWTGQQPHTGQVTNANQETDTAREWHCSACSLTRPVSHICIAYMYREQYNTLHRA